MTNIGKINSFINKYSFCIVALSGGMDSTVLAKLVHDLKKDSMMAVTVRSQLHVPEEIQWAKAFCSNHGIPHKIIDLDLLSDEKVYSNPRERCYYCKKYIFSYMKEHYFGKTIFDGTNSDDINDFRPGITALNELGIISPFKELGISKANIKDMALAWGMHDVVRPSQSCFATRVPYGTPLDSAIIRMISEAESFITGLGIKGVRVRYHGEIARIEVPPSETKTLIAGSDTIVNYLQGLGFSHTTMDLAGYNRLGLG